LRAPLTKNPRLFEKVRAAGARLLWLHTYGERFIPKGKRRGQIPRGAAKCVKPSRRRRGLSRRFRLQRDHTDAPCGRGRVLPPFRASF
jgi:hypothetical protein